MEKNKDEADQESWKPWSKLSRSSYCGLKIKQEKHEEYISNSILGKLYDLVKAEDHNLHSHGVFQSPGTFERLCDRISTCPLILHCSGNSVQIFMSAL